ncbi:MAG TPA: lamin tail domain-containing protein, partial [Prosthecobacter sp.]|nr:lamin tail domain-containing protein [Prosthecobacter sp.]
ADGGTSIVQVTKTGQLVDSMTLAPGGSPQGTTFYDPEGITYVGNNQFVISEERDRQLVLFTYAAGTTLSRSGAKTVKIGTFVPNTGTEGLSWDPQTGGFICLKEIDLMGIFQTNVDFNAGTATNGSPTTVNSVNLFDPALTGMLDFADVFALSNIPALNGRPQAGNLILLSQESANIVNIDRAGNITSTLTIQSDPGNPLTAAAQQHEGVTMDREGKLYVVSENGGGDFDHPQLWVYAPSTVPNQPPAAVALNNAVTSIPENSSTATRVKVADISITDDGLGTNAVTLSGADAGYFEVVAGSLYVKAGTVLDYEAKTSYSLSVSVDDTAVGATPDATVDYTLAVTDIENETVLLPNIIISEVAAWSSGNSPVGGGWFEVTNTGATVVDITGWKVDDNSNSFASAVALSGITSISPGESVIFIETADLPGTSTAFRSNWFGANPPAGLRIGGYSGSGIGLSTGGDALNLYDSAGVLQAKVTFGASPAGPSFPTFNNAEGLNNTAISQLSVAGVNGARVAANSPAEIGSPGTVGRLIISEVAPWSSGNSPVGVDWFEVTNATAHAIDLTGWKVDDSSESFAASVALNGIGSIAPGESVIFIESADLPGITTAFLSNWFGANPPAGLKIGNYSGTGIGLGTGGDAVVLYNGSGVMKAKVFFGASPSTPPYATFDNTAGLDDAAISQLSSVGLNGAFAAANSANEIGSPGSATLGGTPSVSLTVSVTPNTFSESAASPAASGTVTRSGSTAGDLMVTLESSDTTEAVVPASVTILSGQTAAVFDVNAVDDSLPDSSQTVTITASANGTNAGTFALTVTDDGDVAVPMKLILTEVQSNQATAGMNDYWELTNAGATAVDLGNWKWTDSARTLTGAVTIPAGTTIAAGESIIFTSLSAATFRSWWGIGSRVQVITGASAPGLGMSDGVTLFDSGGSEVFFFSYGAGGFTQSSGSAATGGHAGTSGGGTATTALVLNPAFGTEAPRYSAATVGIFGAFASAGNAADIGSPGVVAAAVPSVISFSQAIYSVDQGSESVELTVNRSGGTAPVSVTIQSNDGTASTVPPFKPAVAGIDYTDLSGGETTIQFGENEMSRTVVVALMAKTALNTPNKRFTVALSNPTGIANLGAVGEASVRILAANGASPTLRITAPAGVLDSATWPYRVVGVAGAALGVDRVQVVLNGGTPLVAEVGVATSNAAVPWSVAIEPQEGLNTLVATVFDLSGNSASVRRVFKFTRRYVMTVTRVVPEAVAATPDVAGTVAIMATPSTAASIFAPGAANANPRTATIVPGTVLKMTATPKPGYVFSHWSGTPAGALLLGNVATLTMPVDDISISAAFVPNPFAGPVGAGSTFYGLLHAGG